MIRPLILHFRFVPTTNQPISVTSVISEPIENEYYFLLARHTNWTKKSETYMTGQDNYSKHILSGSNPLHVTATCTNEVPTRLNSQRYTTASTSRK
jgi:hypothetical protein